MLPILNVPPLFNWTHHHVQISVPLTFELMIVLMTLPSASAALLLANVSMQVKVKGTM